MLFRWSTVHISNINTPKKIYYANFQFIIKYGIILWGNSSNSGKILTVQKTIVIIMAGAQPRTSRPSLFKQLEILPAPRQYILSLTSFIINYQDIFQINSSIHNINTRNKHHLHRPNANLSCFQKKSTFYAGIQIFYGLPPSVTIPKKNTAKFKETLRKYQHKHNFYAADDFLCVWVIYNTLKLNTN